MQQTLLLLHRLTLRDNDSWKYHFLKLNVQNIWSYVPSQFIIDWAHNSWYLAAKSENYRIKLCMPARKQELLNSTDANNEKKV